MQGLLLSILFVVLLSLATQPPVAARNPTPSPKALKNRVVHEGCPVYLGFSQDRYTPDYVAGTIPCAAPDSLSPQDRDRVLFVPPVLTGHWVSEVDIYGNSHTWDINAKFGGLVRNKAYEDWNNQCLQTVEYAHTTTGNRNGSETGMFLLDWKFGMNYHGHKHINEDTRIASTVPNLSLHYVYHDPKTTKVVIVHPAPSGLLPNTTLATAATNITSTAGKSLLQALSQLPDPTVKFDFIWEAASGSEMTRSTGPAPAEGTELPISTQDKMSFALAISDDKMWIFTYQLPGYDDGLVSFKREATVPESPQVSTAVEEGCTEIPCPKLSWERKIWDNAITNLQGKWQSEAGDTLSVAMPPHNINSTDAFHAHFMKYLSPGTPKVIQALEQLGTHYIGPHYPGALDIFTLCSHSRIRDFVQVWRNPLSTSDLVVLNYKQNVYVYHPEAKGPGAGVHDELGFFVFDWPNRKITRHGVLPHGSSFEMVSGFPTFSNQPHTDLSAPTMPRFGPKNKFIFRGVNSEEYLSGVQPGVNAEAFQHGRPTVELNDPARLLNEINTETAGDFQGVTTITLHSGNSMDLPFVDKLASRTDKTYTKFVTNITSSFFLSEFGSEEPLLQYIQTVHFNFPVRGTPDIDRSQGRQSTKSAKWPHVIVSSLRRVKEFTGL